MEPSRIDNVGASAVGLDSTDRARLDRLVEYIASTPARVILSMLLAQQHGTPRRGDELRNSLWDRCVFDHGAVFLFPADAEAMRKHLVTVGFQLSTTMASVVVQQRVCARYGLDLDDYRIHIVHARRRSPGSPGGDQRVEIFFPAAPSEHLGLPAFPKHARRVREDERRYNRETHFAFAADGLDMSTYLAMRHHLTEWAGMVPDGGGFNPYDRSHGQGCSTFYFAGPGAVGEHPWPRRLELVCGGRLGSTLAVHNAPAPAPES